MGEELSLSGLMNGVRPHLQEKASNAGRGAETTGRSAAAFSASLLKTRPDLAESPARMLVGSVLLESTRWTDGRTPEVAKALPIARAAAISQQQPCSPGKAGVLASAYRLWVSSP